MDELIGFGRHAKKTYAQVESSYLRFLIESNHRAAPKAEAELRRRGDATAGVQAEPRKPPLVTEHAGDDSFFEGIDFGDTATISVSAFDAGALQPRPAANAHDFTPLGADEPPPGFRLIRVDPGPRVQSYFVVAPKDPRYVAPSKDAKAALEWTQSQFNLPSFGMRCRVTATWLQPEPIEGLVEAALPLLVGDTLPRVQFRPDSLPALWPYGKERCFCPTIDQLEVLVGEAWVPFAIRREPQEVLQAA